ncbi:hypothetical protein OV079_21050 [Nannocystis pusilla]|uniref:Uncharacterized protein n=1 Tax=Nannocystis pusilla TaxID=889268 RepID=A0A9X3EPP1_9BACT|nr:hypothetical protein [Nannocystis pusilla]
MTGPTTHQSPVTNCPTGRGASKVQVMPYWVTDICRLSGVPVVLVGSGPVVTSVVGAVPVVVPVVVRSPLEVVPVVVVAFGSVVAAVVEVDEVVAASVPPEPPPQARANEQASAQVTTSRRSIAAFYKKYEGRAGDRASRASPGSSLARGLVAPRCGGEPGTTRGGEPVPRDRFPCSAVKMSRGTGRAWLRPRGHAWGEPVPRDRFP